MLSSATKWGFSFTRTFFFPHTTSISSSFPICHTLLLWLSLRFFFLLLFFSIHISVRVFLPRFFFSSLLISKLLCGTNLCIQEIRPIVTHVTRMYRDLLFSVLTFCSVYRHNALERRGGREKWPKMSILWIRSSLVHKGDTDRFVLPD